jgi:hypothetical protein
MCGGNGGWVHAPFIGEPTPHYLFCPAWAGTVDFQLGSHFTGDQETSGGIEVQVLYNILSRGVWNGVIPIHISTTSINSCRHADRQDKGSKPVQD